MASNTTNGSAAPSPSATPAAPRPPVLVNAALLPKKGVLTFQAEGREGGPYHSRVLQLPPGASGLTLGRGYDMKEKSHPQIVRDLTKAGVSAADAALLANAPKTGQAARNFMKEHPVEIGSDTQINLFEISYDQEAAEVARISNKKDTAAAYGKLDVGKLDPALKDLLVDLKFRGDYTPASRKLLQKAFVDNDLKKIQSVMGNSANWHNVPADRFNRRKEFIDNFVKAKGSVPTNAPSGAPGHVVGLGKKG